MLRVLEPDQLWCIETPMPLLGLRFGARLTIARLSNGALWVHAPLAISDDDAKAIGNLGEVGHIVAPNSFHYQEIGEFTARFPRAQLWVVPALATKLDDLPHLPLRALPPAWAEDFDAVLFDAALGYQEWVFCHRATCSLILTDLIINVPRPDNSLGRVAGALLDEGRGPKPSRLVRASIYAGRQRSQASALLDQILGWDFERVIMAHGRIVEQGGKRLLRRAFGWL